jgi:hypothetical protein
LDAVTGQLAVSTPVVFRARNARLIKGAIQQFPRGTHKWMPGEVLLIARLLAYEHEGRGTRRTGGCFSENGLRARAPQVASFAPGGGLAQSPQGRFRRDQIGGCADAHTWIVLSPARTRKARYAPAVR